MSTAALYHIHGIRGYKHRAIKWIKGRMEWQIEQPKEKCVCSQCGNKNIIFKGKKVRRFLSVPSGSKQVTIVLGVPRVYCPECDLTRQVAVPFARPMTRHTRSFERYVLGMIEFATTLDVANHLGVSWGLVRSIEEAMLRKKYGKPRLKDVRVIAIDEIAVKKGHNYITIVTDLDSGQVIHVGDGAGAESLVPFWRRLRASQAKIQAVATDMSPAYIAAVEKNLPQALQVFDRFHVVKLLNKHIDDLRKRIQRDMSKTSDKQALKRLRWILLKRRDNLDPLKGEPDRLEAALQANHDLYVAYFLKEELCEFWNQEDYDTAEGMLVDWLAYAEASGIPELISFCKTIRNHALGMLAYYDFNITTGPLEGLNNKIKTLKRKAYGFRNDEYFKLKIYAIHKTRYALVG